MLEQLRYPIGRFIWPERYLPDSLTGWIETIEQFPIRLRVATMGLANEELDTPYRPGGWTIRQVVHHTADSHLNSLIRFKWALTEVEPTLKPYDEQQWAQLPDSALPIEPSLLLLQGLHLRWAQLLRHLTPQQWERRIAHPDWARPQPLWALLALYDWHSRHHLAHITGIRRRENF